MSRRLGGALCLLIVLCLTGLVAAGRTQQDGPIFDDQIHVERWEDLRYPLMPLKSRVEGSVVLSATLRDDGSVAEASAVSGTRVLIPACLENVKQWKFRPNASKRVVIVYVFNIEGACNDSAQSLFRLTHNNVAMISGCTGPL